VIDRPAKTDKHHSDEVVLDPAGELLPLVAEESEDRANSAAYRQLNALLNDLQILSSQRQLDNILSRLPAAVALLTEAQRCFIISRSRDRQLTMLRCWPGSEMPAMPDSDAWPISRTIVHRVLDTGDAILSNRALIELAEIASLHKNAIRAVLCTPLGARGQPEYVIYADSQSAGSRFLEFDLRALTVLANCTYQAICRCRELERVEIHRNLLQAELLQQHDIVCKSQSMLSAYDQLRRVAPRQMPILILGPSGVGKDLFAKAAHRLSPRASAPFVKIDIAALPDDLVDSELFGHSQHAFTGAQVKREGRFALADTGTIFLDEIGNISLRLQAKLLQVLEQGEFFRIGIDTPLKTNVRVVCATNVDLSDAVEKGTFRRDLYHRIAGAVIEIPALAKRTEDIPVLAEGLLRRIGSAKRLAPATVAVLQHYSWPGNVRELMRVLEVMDTIDDEVIEPSDLPAHVRRQAPASEDISHSTILPMAEVVAQAERNHMRRALEATGGAANKAKQLLKMSNEQFFRKKKLYEL
jgi:Nif-specific regulatory protein